MKPNTKDLGWQRLVAAARQAPDTQDSSVPFGFATRVAALAMARPQASLASALDRFSWRALGVACLLMTIGIASSYSTLASLGDDETIPQDPVSETIEISS